MYAVVATGGKQIKVAPGDVVRVEKIEGAVGDTVSLDQVKLVAKDDGLVIDPSALESARVDCTITNQDRRKKIRVFKYKRRKNYSRRRGHRQYFTELKINSIDV